MSINMTEAIKDVLCYMRKRTVDMTEEDYELFLAQLKDEISQLQALAEWKDDK